MDVIISIGLVAFLLVLGFSAGTIAEKRHYRSIREREKKLRKIMVFALHRVPPDMRPCRTALVSGSVVVGMDYFKMFLARLRNIVGGRVGSFETLYDRGRREAVLRMKEEARALKAVGVFNVKFTTVNVMSGDKQNKGSGCVEVMAYGTAIIPERT